MNVAWTARRFELNLVDLSGKVMCACLNRLFLKTGEMSDFPGVFRINWNSVGHRRQLDLRVT
jgi:hypothetical protein